MWLGISNRVLASVFQLPGKRSVSSAIASARRWYIRGFRNCVGVMHALGLHVAMPPFLSGSSSQLSKPTNCV
ncbi:unnamed protein product [Didymodactylos carnosus]|uniref:Uncharacterized protein n=1 Tax=Didymodactylos carnosus TaxID=1234261 RepID=A0A8S2EXQ8_9BILA|nr:unnamed protein product [Didymodactylos carnosus]CAF4092620.1 unnamed protein product [Didymodactylos carnosus]